MCHPRKKGDNNAQRHSTGPPHPRGEELNGLGGRQEELNKVEGVGGTEWKWGVA